MRITECILKEHDLPLLFKLTVTKVNASPWERLTRAEYKVS